MGHGRYKFCLLTLSSAPVARGDLTFFLTRADQLHDERRRFQLSAQDFALINPNTLTCPVFRTRVDADLTRAVYSRVPVLMNDATGENAWGVQFYAMFHMSNDSPLFSNSSNPQVLPLYEAKLFYQFNHRLGTYAGRSPQSEDSELPRPTLQQLQNPDYAVTPRYWVPKEQVETLLTRRWERAWTIAFRDIATATNERTSIFSVLPRVGVGNSAPLLLFEKRTSPSEMACALAGLNSLAFDYVTRQKIAGNHMNFFFVKQLPVLPPSAYLRADLDFIVPRVLELTYTAWDLKPFADDLGYDGPPFRWDEGRRALLRAELDAYYAALYGLTRDELRYILDPADVYGPDFPGETFRVLKEREIRELGEYRTRRLVLEAWDRLGLEPRNRDGRYEVTSPPSPPRRGEGGQEPAPARGRSSRTGQKQSTTTEWAEPQGQLPGMSRKGGQLGFDDLG